MMNRSGPGFLAFAAAALSFAIAGSPATASTAVPPEKIQQGIDRARQWIYRHQYPGGRWEKDTVRHGSEHAEYLNMQGDTFGGYTALATYALLASGESPNEPRIKAAVEFLKNADIVGIYAIAMRCQVWLLIPHQSDEIKALIRADAEALFRGLNDGKLNPNNKGLWDYLGQGRRVDHSVSQYGVLGLWACQQTGAVDVGHDRWKLMETAWRAAQHPQGGWDYGTLSDQTPAMTAAGIASLFIIGDYLHSEEGIGCLGNSSDPWIDHGLAWMDTNYDRIRDDGYAMYGIERVGAASGYRYFGSRDWFNDLAKRLLADQNEDGSFNTGAYPGSQPLDETCFGLLFLSRGRAPVLMNKLDYHSPNLADTQPALVNWNERPRDIANLTAWTGHQAERFLQWQIINLKADPEDLHDAPIIYLSGSDELKLSSQDARKLKAFIEEGGMILGNADCGHPEFAQSFQALGQSMFAGRTFRELRPSHPIFTHEQFPAARWRQRPRLLGLSNGSRELMLLVPDADPARWWQSMYAAGPHEDAYELGADLYQYAIDRQVWNRGASYMLAADPMVKTSRTIKLARLEIGSNWDPEPAGWRRLATMIHNEDQIELVPYAAPMGQGALTAARVAHLTGTTEFALSPGAALELKTFVKNGGTVVIDAAGGSVPFADAAERELKTLFGQAAEAGLAQPLPRDHAIYFMPGHPISTFLYRAWARQNRVGNLKDPRIRGIEIGERVAVFFSREDLSAGLVGEPIDGVIGYTPDVATQIMRNILLYSAPKEQPATQPANGPASIPVPSRPL